MNNKHSLPSPLIESVAGFTAGVAATVVVHPLDVIKTRLQVNRASNARLGGSRLVVQQILRDEAGFRALYRGLSPNLVGNSVSWALYFLWYDQIKHAMVANHGRRQPLSYYDYFLASGTAGILTAICTNPIWVIKTRMLSTSAKHSGAYISIQDGTRRIYNAEGLSGFYRGLVPSLFGVSHGALQFMAYEQMKAWRDTQGSEKQSQLRSQSRSQLPQLSNLDYLVFSGLSKILAGSLTYPYQVIRARLQTYDAAKRYNSTRDVVYQVWKKEGFQGFYKGLGPNLLRVVPSSCVTFLVYENTKAFLPRL
ncbi:hypothetical protein MMC34_006208 [Xylographa carneopallida]|nr:hypothetical protein [Xylographa carneopallida]